MSQLKFRGLVRAMNHVRTQLATGLSPDEVDAFRDYVKTTVRTVERGCKDAGIRPADLPAPSYRAYRFLKSVDLRRLPIRTAETPPAPGPIRVTSVVAVCNRMQRAITELVPADGRPPLPEDPRVEDLRAVLARHVAVIEELCRGDAGRPEDLPVRSRQGYQWLRLLSRPGRLAEHVATLSRVLHEGQAQLARDRRPAAQGIRRLAVQMAYSNTLISGKRTGDKLEIRLHQGFVGAPPDVLGAVGSASLGERQALARLREYALSSQFRAIIAEIERNAESQPAGSESRAGGRAPGARPRKPSSTRGETSTDPSDDGDALFGGDRPSTSAAGRHHNLVASFDRVNRAYFAGGMPRPKLTWNSTITHRKLGHYKLHSDEVMLSVTLDDPRVPAYVVDFVMYHELLHKQLGVRAVNGRQRAHTPEFRRAEQRFKDYRKAEAFLQRLGERVDL